MKPIHSFLSSLSRILGRLENLMCAVALGSVSLIITGQVFTRYLFNYTPSWSEELSRYLIVWTIFIGVAVGVRKNIHIGVDAFIRLAPPNVKRALEVLLNVIGAVVSGVLIYLAVLFILDTIEYEQLSPAMQIPMYLPYLAMPVGLGLAVVHFVHDVVKLLATGAADEAKVEAPAAPLAIGPQAEVSP